MFSFKMNTKYLKCNMNANSRTKVCLLGQLAGDALGSQVEFQTPGQIIASHPEGPGELTGSPIFNTLPGQPQMTQRWRFCLPGCLQTGEHIPRKKHLKHTSSGLNHSRLTAGLQ